MPTLEWSDAFVLDLPLMDQTHQEFVDLLAAVETADDLALMPAWQALVRHTEDHFAREDRWMVDTRFSASNCHTTQHQIVLQVMQQGEEKGLLGDLAMVRQMASELAVWFPQHAHSMDAALSAHLHRVGYDPHTGAIHSPQALPVAEIHGCASDRCSDTEPVGEVAETNA
jgi:hemerythrin-like metal-binding protein